jgi:hypothetical protein
MTKKVFALDTKPGVQRDGTIFDKEFYNSGVWCRFQRGRPRKMWGVRSIVNTLAGPSRGIYVVPQNGFNYVYNGYAYGLQEVPIDNNGVGSGVLDFTLSGFTPDDKNLWQFDTLYDTFGQGANLLVAHPGHNLNQIDSTENTPVLGGSLSGTSLSKIGVFSITATTTVSTATFTAAISEPIGAGQLVISSAFPAGTRVVSFASGTVTVDQNATASGSQTIEFDNEVSVSGGVVAMHPYLFVYGNDGLIRNCAAGNTNDWVSADADEVNVATGKIVKALPVRGGSNAPSGLFWSLDSLIRVSYIGGSGSPPQYWRRDTITNQSSIMSSQSVIEYDGVYYWCGVDRFLMYNGVVQEIQNNMNQNHFFDNLNYAQRQKVYVTKVPRFGEIWWFYPRGDATECNDAIIYNVREKVWYDAGSAVNARRSAGYFSQVFRYPVNAGTQINDTGTLASVSIASPGSGYTSGTYNYEPLTGGTGTGATANIVVTLGAVTSVTINDHGSGYEVGDTLSASLPAGAGFQLNVDYTTGTVTLWQHETGRNQINGTSVLAIESSFETNDLGWVSGGPSQPSPIGENRWIHLDRVEPDFLMVGEMELYVTGRPYAQSQDETSGPYVFDENTNKIDLREQRRELRLQFKSNVVDGDYQAGKIIVDADMMGDVRGY